MKRLLWIGAAVLLIAIVAYSLRPSAVVVEIGSPERRTVREYIAEEAKTRLGDTYVVDMPISGTLKPIPWEIGDVVEKGAILAEIETFDLEQRLRGLQFLIEQARAQIGGVETGKPKPEDFDTAAVRVREARNALAIAKQEAELASIDFEEARRDYERAQRLADQEVLSRNALDDAELAFNAAREQLERARLAVEAARKNVEIAELAKSRVTSSVDDNEYLREVYQAEIDRLNAELAVVRRDLEKAVIHAPVRGPILEKLYDNERVLAAGTPILTQGDLSTMEIETDILSEEVVQVRQGDPVELIGRALGGADVTGTVARIYPSAFQKISSLGIEQQRVKVIVAFDNSALNLRTGTRLDVHIIVDESPDTIAVPERAVFRQNDAWHIFVVAGGEARLQPVTLGLKNDTWAEVTEGLSPDDKIVLEPNNEIGPGSRVEAR